MDRPMRLRTRRLVAFGGVFAVALALFLSWGLTTVRVSAHSPHPGLNFTMTAEGEEDCDTSAGDTVCYIDPGTTFTLNVTLDSLPDGVSQYEAFDVTVEYTGLTSADNASTASWPDCGFPAQFFEEGLVAMSCAIGIPPAEPSTYTGLLGTNDFTCDESGAITLRHGEGNTNLVEAISLIHGEGAGTAETLSITCGDRPTATPPPTATPRPGLPPSGSAGAAEGSDSGLWAAIGALLAAAAAGLTVFGWRFARSR